MVRKYVGNLMFGSEESRKTSKIQSNSIYKLQFIQFVEYLDTNMAKSEQTYFLCLHITTNELQKKFQSSNSKTIL